MIKIAKTLFTVYRYILLFIAVVLISLMLLPKLFGIQPFVIMSGSMEPNVPTKSICYVKPYEGDERIPNNTIVAFKKGETVIVHRVVDYSEYEKGYTTKGDANEQYDGYPKPYGTKADSIIGTFVFVLPFLGGIVLWLQSMPGIITIIVAVLISILSSFLVISDKETDNEEKEAKEEKMLKKKKQKTAIAVEGEQQATQSPSGWLDTDYTAPDEKTLVTLINGEQLTGQFFEGKTNVNEVANGRYNIEITSDEQEVILGMPPVLERLIEEKTKAVSSSVDTNEAPEKTVEITTSNNNQTSVVSTDEFEDEEFDTIGNDEEFVDIEDMARVTETDASKIFDAAKNEAKEEIAEDDTDTETYNTQTIISAEQTVEEQEPILDDDAFEDSIVVEDNEPLIDSETSLAGFSDNTAKLVASALSEDLDDDELAMIQALMEE